MRFLRIMILPVMATAVMLSACNRHQEPAKQNGSAVQPSAVVGVVDDSAITAKVKAALIADPAVKSFDFKVNTKDGDVELSGTVDNQTQIDHAVEIVRKVEGVKNVTNHLNIKP